LFPLLFFAEDAEHLALVPDVTWLSAAAGVWIVVMLACGMIPVLSVPHRDPALVLRRDALGSSTASRKFRVRLVMMQLALCSTLVVVAGVIREDLRASIRSSRGRIVGSLLVARVASDAGPFDAGNGLRYVAQVEHAAKDLPGVTATAWTATLPAGRPASQEFTIELPEKEWREIELDVATFSPQGVSADRLRVTSGRMFGIRDSPGACRVALINKEAADRYFDGDAVGRSLEDVLGSAVQIIGVLASPPNGMAARPALFYYDQQNPAGVGVERERVFRGPRLAARKSAVTMDANVTSPEYFDVFADPPIAGRAYGAADRGTACRVAVVSEEAALTVFDGRAVGAAVMDASGDRIEIVGVVRAEALGATRRGAASTIFLPLAQSYRQAMVLAMRTADVSPALSASAESRLGAVGGGKLLSSVTTLEEHLERTSLASARIASTLVGVCAVLAFALSMVGLYALMADLVQRRKRELALRVALGAGPWRLIASIVREGLGLAARGGAAGLLLAVAGTPLLDRFVVEPQLPRLMVVAVAIAALAALVTLACAVPAWRAVSVDPRLTMNAE
jgi:ABC-type antimicrobial peptide transport system permease subunit